MTESEIRICVKRAMGEKRFLHTERCVDMADRLAERWGVSIELARRAAWLHDITKELPYDEQLRMIADHGVELNETQRSEKVIHAFTGAIVAREQFGEGEDVCGAIRWHTTARKDMTLLEKIIWLADLTEEGRDFPGVEEIRKLAFEHIGKALILGFETTLSFLEKQGSKIDMNMKEALDFEIAALAKG